MRSGRIPIYFPWRYQLSGLSLNSEGVELFGLWIKVVIHRIEWVIHNPSLVKER